MKKYSLYLTLVLIFGFQTLFNAAALAGTKQVDEVSFNISVEDYEGLLRTLKEWLSSDRSSDDKLEARTQIEKSWLAISLISRDLSELTKVNKKMMCELLGLENSEIICSESTLDKNFTAEQGCKYLFQHTNGLDPETNQIVTNEETSSFKKVIESCRNINNYGRDRERWSEFSDLVERVHYDINDNVLNRMAKEYQSQFNETIEQAFESRRKSQR